MSTNNDGLEPGQPVDFYTLMRIKSEQRGKKDGDPKPAKRGRKAKEGFHRPEEQRLQDSSGATGTEEA